MTLSPRTADRRLLLVIAGFVLLLIVVVSLLAPSTATNDPRPSTYNTAPGGAEAAFLTLQALGQPVARWEQPLNELPPADASHTTLVLAEPQYSALEKDRLAASLHSFLDRGGRLLTTGVSGALLIPGGATRPTRRFGALCYTQPEGPGPLARAGKVEMADNAAWASAATAKAPAVRVEQRCGDDAVVVRVPVGAGEAVWWSSASPLTNAELHNEADLHLLLASLDSSSRRVSAPPRRILFDESLQQPVRSKWSAAAGLPLWSLLAQGALVFALLVFSFSRRRGPVRLPVSVPRSSPVEFAVSMGDLYGRAGATGVATAAAKRRLERILVRDAGLPRSSAKGDSAEVAKALNARFGGNWTALADHLREARDTVDAPLRTRSALALVRALGEDAARVIAAVQPGPGSLPRAPSEQREKTVAH